MAVTAAVAAVVTTGASIYQSERSRKEAKSEAKKAEKEQFEFQRKVREEEERNETQRGMIAARARQRSMSSWDAGNSALGGGANAAGGQASKSLLGL